MVQERKRAIHRQCDPHIPGQLLGVQGTAGVVRVPRHLLSIVIPIGDTAFLLVRKQCDKTSGQGHVQYVSVSEAAPNLSIL